MIKVPQYLSTPVQIAWFEADEISIIGILFTNALVFWGWASWALLITGTYFYITAKHKYQRGFLKHMFFFIGLTVVEGYPGPFEKDFME